MIANSKTAGRRDGTLLWKNIVAKRENKKICGSLNM